MALTPPSQTPSLAPRCTRTNGLPVCETSRLDCAPHPQVRFMLLVRWVQCVPGLIRQMSSVRGWPAMDPPVKVGV